MKTKLLAALFAVGLSLSAGAASADTDTVNFVIHGGDWANAQSGDPFGAAPNADLYGSFTVTVPDAFGNVWVDQSQITDLTFTAGTQTWTAADLAPNAEVVEFTYIDGAEQVGSFILEGNGFSAATDGGLGSLVSGRSFWACAACVTWNSPAGIPEPSAWVLSILGLGLTGSALRYRRRVISAVSA
jgi:hypothetical protein